MQLTSKELEYDLTHKHGGNGWAIVEMLDDNFCRITELPVGKHKRTQAFLAWGNMLSRTMTNEDPKDVNSKKIERRLDEDHLSKLSPIRDAIKSGSKAVRSSWIVEA